jgi:hypothetical protein
MMPSKPVPEFTVSPVRWIWSVLVGLVFGLASS